MPDLITNKGNALALIGAHIFEKLADPKFWQKLPQSAHLKKFDPSYLQKRFVQPLFKEGDGVQQNGLPAHFLGLYKGTKQSNSWQDLEPIFKAKENKSPKDYSKDLDLANSLLMHVLAAQVDWPKSKNILHENIYFYPPVDSNYKRRLIPLEVVFRFGMVEGSSLKKKLQENPDYANSLGLKTVPRINEWFPQPTLEFFTKLEAKDRLLSWQEAALLANLSAQQFKQLVDLSLSTALALHVLFAECNLELWDGKLEFIYEQPTKGHANKEGRLLLADSIGPDELRLLHNGIHLSKEMLRQYYRSSAWAKSLITAQNIANKNERTDQERTWQEICQQELKQSPQLLAADMKKLANELYSVLANEILGQKIFVESS